MDRGHWIALFAVLIPGSCLLVSLFTGCSSSTPAEVPPITKTVIVKQINYMPSSLQHGEGHIPRIRVILTLDDQSKLVLFNYENEVHKYLFIPGKKYKITYKGNGRLIEVELQK